MEQENLMEKLISLCKRRGFVYQGSEIYGGLSGTWDYGPLGVALKKNIEAVWWRQFVDSRDNMFGLDTSVIMSEKVWQASGHLEGFSDPMVECSNCKSRFRADHLEDKNVCPSCGKKGTLGETQQFNLMLPVQMGATEGRASTGYLRGEIAQGMFVNFKNVVDSLHPKLPFGLAQSGRAFRNEIAPRDFLFRVREFDLMEFEYFIRETDWEKWFEYWRNEMWKWIEGVGITKDSVHELEVAPEDRAHYSKRTIDFEFDFPFGRKELYGLAYRTDYDLGRHIEKSGVDMRYGEEGEEKFVPHVIEPTFGLGRTVLAVLTSAYTEDELGGEKRVYLKFKPNVAPVKAAVFPLLKNKPELVEKAREVYADLKKEIPQIVWDDNGNIGKRYRRQDEIGTPWCITVDFDTLGDPSRQGGAEAGNADLKDTVTLRDRDSGEQKRVPISELSAMLKAQL